MTTNNVLNPADAVEITTVKMLNPFNATEKEDFNNVAAPGVGSGNPAPTDNETHTGGDR